MNVRPETKQLLEKKIGDKVLDTDLANDFFFKINLFIYLGLHWVFVAACRLSLVAASGGYSSLR